MFKQISCNDDYGRFIPTHLLIAIIGKAPQIATFQAWINRVAADTEDSFGEISIATDASGSRFSKY